MLNIYASPFVKDFDQFNCARIGFHEGIDMLDVEEKEPCEVCGSLLSLC